MDIGLILAHTPQAKGRIERLWGAFQGRLASELRLAGASTIEQANEVLGDFVSRYNRSFDVPAALTGSAYRQMRPDLHLDSVLCFKYVRVVDNDNTVRFGNSTIQLLADEHRASYARAKVEVQERDYRGGLPGQDTRICASGAGPRDTQSSRWQPSQRPCALRPARRHSP